MHLAAEWKSWFTVQCAQCKTLDHDNARQLGLNFGKACAECGASWWGTTTLFPKQEDLHTCYAKKDEAMQCLH